MNKKWQEIGDIYTTHVAVVVFLTKTIEVEVKYISYILIDEQLILSFIVIMT